MDENNKKQNERTEPRELSLDELEDITGGAAESQAKSSKEELSK